MLIGIGLDAVRASVSQPIQGDVWSGTDFLRGRGIAANPKYVDGATGNSTQYANQLQYITVDVLLEIIDDILGGRLIGGDVEEAVKASGRRIVEGTQSNDSGKGSEE